MAAEDIHIELAPPSAVTTCRKKKTENGSFVENLKDHFQEFIHTPMDEHKACFKQTLQKIIEKFTEKTSSSPKGENPVAPLQTAPKN